MEIDKTTLGDLSIFNQNEEPSVFAKLNLTRTTGGSRKLQQIFSNSQERVENIIDVQDTLKLFLEKENGWPLGETHNPTADDGRNCGRNAEHHRYVAHQSLCIGPIVHIADDGPTHDESYACTQTLQRTKEQQHL